MEKNGDNYFLSRKSSSQQESFRDQLVQSVFRRIMDTRNTGQAFSAAADVANRRKGVLLLLNILGGMITMLHANCVALASEDRSYRQRRQLQMNLFDLSVTRILFRRMLKKRRASSRRRYWIRPGRTSPWWENIRNEVAQEEE